MGGMLTAKTKYLQIELKKCSNKPTCKDDEEIEQFLQYHRIWLAFNEQQIEPDKFSD